MKKTLYISFCCIFLFLITLSSCSNKPLGIMGTYDSFDSNPNMLAAFDIGFTFNSSEPIVRKSNVFNITSCDTLNTDALDSKVMIEYIKDKSSFSRTTNIKANVSARMFNVKGDAEFNNILNSTQEENSILYYVYYFRPRKTISYSPDNNSIKGEALETISTQSVFKKTYGDFFCDAKLVGSMFIISLKIDYFSQTEKNEALKKINLSGSNSVAQASGNFSLSSEINRAKQSGRLNMQVFAIGISDSTTFVQRIISLSSSKADTNILSSINDIVSDHISKTTNLHLATIGLTYRALNTVPKLTSLDEADLNSNVDYLEDCKDKYLIIKYYYKQSDSLLKQSQYGKFELEKTTYERIEDYQQSTYSLMDSIEMKYNNCLKCSTRPGCDSCKKLIKLPPPSDYAQLQKIYLAYNPFYKYENNQEIELSPGGVIIKQLIPNNIYVNNKNVKVHISFQMLTNENCGTVNGNDDKDCMVSGKLGEQIIIDKDRPIKQHSNGGKLLLQTEHQYQPFVWDFDNLQVNAETELSLILVSTCLLKPDHVRPTTRVFKDIVVTLKISNPTGYINDKTITF